MAKVSVIVPVYKTEAYLCRCLDSISAQTFKDWECIIVDDGSPDNSGAICDEYAEKDSRFRVIHKVNGGVSTARNTGIENSSGEWLCFVDSDDYVSTTYLSDMYISANKYRGDFIFSGNIAFKNNQIVQRNISKSLIVYGRIDFPNLLIKGFLRENAAPWGKLFKARLIVDNKIEFQQDMPCGEDACFVFDYLRFSHKVIILPIANYYYDLSIEESLTKTIFSYEKEWLGLRTYYKKANLLGLSLRNTSALDYLLLHILLERVIVAIYRDSKSRKQRILRLSNLEDVHFSKYLRSYTLWMKFHNFFLVHKLWCLYDLLQILFVKLYG